MIFRFKQFEVSHGVAAMKVGTDGVTLGAWAPCHGRVLDVGAGCGLIGLMAAQRGAEHVTLLEIDPDAALEAAGNARRSPWANRISALQGDFLTHQDAPYDCIISNPPFFASGALAPNAARATARHEGTLTPAAFMQAAVRLLAQAGVVSIIIPPDRRSAWVSAAATCGLYPQCEVSLLTGDGAIPRRLLLTFAASVGPECRRSSLHIASAEYKALTFPFYL